jgi:hypothetical protein
VGFFRLFLTSVCFYIDIPFPFFLLFLKFEVGGSFQALLVFLLLRENRLLGL